MQSIAQKSISEPLSGLTAEVLERWANARPAGNRPPLFKVCEPLGDFLAEFGAQFPVEAVLEAAGRRLVSMLAEEHLARHQTLDDLTADAQRVVRAVAVVAKGNEPRIAHAWNGSTHW